MPPPLGPISLVTWAHIIGDIGPPTRPHIPRDMGPMLSDMVPPPPISVRIMAS